MIIGDLKKLKNVIYMNIINKKFYYFLMDGFNIDPVFSKDTFGNEIEPFFVDFDGKLRDFSDEFKFLLEECEPVLPYTYTLEDWKNRSEEKEKEDRRKIKLLHRKSEIVRRRLVYQDTWSDMHFDYSFQWDPCKKVVCPICDKKAPILIVLCPYCNVLKCTDCSFAEPKCPNCKFYNFPDPPYFYRNLAFYDQLGWTFFTEIDGFKKVFKNFSNTTLGESYRELLKGWNNLIIDLTDLIEKIK